MKGTYFFYKSLIIKRLLLLGKSRIFSKKISKASGKYAGVP